MAVRGKLKDISLASLISVNCNEMNQSRLVVWRDNEEAVVFFDGGNIVHMTLGNLEGDAVISELLAWEDGEFELEPAVPTPRRTVQTPWSTLLLEGMQHVDESSQAHLMPMDDPVPTPGDKGEAAGLLAKLRAVDGVTGAVIVARDGNVIAADMEGDAEKEGAVAVFVGSAASQIGESLALGPFERGLVETSGSKVRMLILERSEYYAGVLLAERASPTLVAAKVTGILQ